jgi:hypothetical protein
MARKTSLILAIAVAAVATMMALESASAQVVRPSTTTSAGRWDGGLHSTIGISRMDRSMSGRTDQSSRARTDFKVPMRRIRR